MKLVYKNFLYEATLLEMPSLISLDDDELEGNAQREIDKLLANSEEVDSKFEHGVDWSIRESTTNACILFISDAMEEPLGYVKFNKMHSIPNAIAISMTYLYEANRGQGIMSIGYEYLLDHYGIIVSDSDLTDDSVNLYRKLANKYHSYLYDYKNKKLLNLKFESEEYNAFETKAYIEGTSGNYRVVISKNEMTTA